MFDFSWLSLYRWEYYCFFGLSCLATVVFGYFFRDKLGKVALTPKELWEMLKHGG